MRYPIGVETLDVNLWFRSRVRRRGVTFGDGDAQYDRPPMQALPPVERLAARVRPHAWRARSSASGDTEGHARFDRVVSQPCTHAQVISLDYHLWAERVGERPLLHRGQWEWLYVLQALQQEGVVRPGARGLGFGAGEGPIAAHLAARDCRLVVAGPLPGGVATLHRPELCTLDELSERVAVRAIDPSHIRPELHDLDFVWSTGAADRRGDLDAGMQFVIDTLTPLRPGGVAVHTLTYNLSSNVRTVRSGPTVALRRRDLEHLAHRLRSAGHHTELLFDHGRLPGDAHVDRPPFSTMHLRTTLGSHVVTSFGLLIRKGGAAR